MLLPCYCCCVLLLLLSYQLRPVQPDQPGIADATFTLDYTNVEKDLHNLQPAVHLRHACCASSAAACI